MKRPGGPTASASHQPPGMLIHVHDTAGRTPAWLSSAEQDPTPVETRQPPPVPVTTTSPQSKSLCPASSAGTLRGSARNTILPGHQRQSRLLLLASP